MINSYGKGQLFYASWRRMGDHLRHATGKVEVECPECGGKGQVDLHNDGTPRGEKWRTCPECHGFGTVWIDAPEEPE